MKYVFFALAGILLAFTLTPVVAHSSFISQDYKTGNEPSYVVIGAFSIHKNAVRFTNHANRLSDQLKSKASYQLNAARNLYYVYVLITEDHTQAIEEANRLRHDSQFGDTWVYQGDFKETMPDSNVAMQGVDINPVTEKQIDMVAASDNNTATQQILNESEQVMASADITHIQAVNTNASLTNELPADNTEGKNFMFKIYRPDDQAEIIGDVDVIDSERSRKMGSYKGNTTVRVASPLSKSGDMAFVCEIFGYRKLQKNFNFTTRQGDDVTIEENKTVVPFELTRLKKGDIAVMYNVYFFKDAGIMRPESRYEVNSLVDMLKENSKYKIKIHGHTNGSAAGKIISMGDDKNFFSLNGTKEGLGSAKKLSAERADVIREYLIANGIDADRMEIKAWGGKHPVYDKHSSKAQENVRVEIEILQD